MFNIFGVKYNWKLLFDDILNIKFIIFCNKVVFLEWGVFIINMFLLFWFKLFLRDLFIK